MAESIVTWCLSAAGLYLLFGFLFAVVFVFRGAGSIDPVARAGTWGFRLIILPGVMVFWPLLARRWCSGRAEPPEECNPHRAAARRFKA